MTCQEKAECRRLKEALLSQLAVSTRSHLGDTLRRFLEQNETEKQAYKDWTQQARAAGLQSRVGCNIFETFQRAEVASEIMD